MQYIAALTYRTTYGETHGRTAMDERTRTLEPVTNRLRTNYAGFHGTESPISPINASYGVPAPPAIVFVLGGPGSGKGTQCERLVRDFGFIHLSAGDLLREEVASGSPLGKQCDALMKEGKLVPMETTIALLQQAMSRAPPGAHFLIDGFPRALDQGLAFEATVAPCSFVLFFDCPLETMQQRLLKRGETSGRADDNIATIKKRFDTFTNQSLPVIDYFEQFGKVHRISSVPPADEVYEEVYAAVASRLGQPGAATSGVMRRY